jgi:hypothetical protein
MEVFVTHLHKIMLDVFKRRCDSAGTIRYFVRFVERFDPPGTSKVEIDSEAL